MIEALKERYIDFINEIDPFWEAYEAPEDVTEISPEEMLYNLEEIRENNFPNPYQDEETILLVLHLDALINQFKAAGIRRIDA